MTKDTLKPTRAGAFAAGDMLYFTGVPCPYGHTDVRYAKTGQCKACVRESARKAYKSKTGKTRKRWTTETIVDAFRQVHGDLFDYASVQYTRHKDKVSVLCAEHGVFQVTPDNHLLGKGCPRCAAQGTAQRCNKGVDRFIADARALWGARFDYTKVVYVDAKTPVSIKCWQHDQMFLQTPTNHLSGKVACSRCNHTKSAPEASIASMLALFTDVVPRDRTLLKPRELDMYLPARRLAIEYCGEYWHSHGDAEDEAARSMNHYRKHKDCAALGVRLITIFETEWLEHNYAIRRLLRNAAGAGRGRLMARKCRVGVVSSADARAFYDRYHPQGGTGVGEHYGLFWGSALVACMRFTEGANDRGANKNRVWTLSRYATRITVAGGASRLFSAFLQSKNPKEVKSFSDDRYFDGGMYEKLGFTLEENTKPDYQVWHPKLGLRPKSHYQRRLLPARAAELGLRMDFDPSTDPRTERDITYLIGARRIYDCGKKRWVWRRP